MNLPEGRLREVIELSFRKRVMGFDALSLLEVVERSQIKRLRFANDHRMAANPAFADP